MAHNVHPTDSELERLAASGTAISHCPCSNAALGSGLFPLRRHIAAGVKCALGTDVGGGTGFGMLKEGLQAYLLQRLAADGVLLSPGHLLYLATRAGAEALGMDEEIGDFSPGKSADLVYLRPPEGSPLAAVVEQAGDAWIEFWRRCSHWPARRASARFAWKASAVYRSPKHDHRRSEFSGSRAVCRGDRLGLRTLAVGGRTSLGGAAVRERRRAASERWWIKWSSASAEEQLALLRAHPDLGTRARVSDASSGGTGGRGARPAHASGIRASSAIERGLS